MITTRAPAESIAPIRNPPFRMGLDPRTRPRVDRPLADPRRGLYDPKSFVPLRLRGPDPGGDEPP